MHQGSKGKTSKQTKKQTLDAPIGVKFRSRSRKRVYAAATPTTGPSSNKSISQPDTCLAPNDIHVPPTSNPAVSEPVEPADQGYLYYHVSPYMTIDFPKNALLLSAIL